MQPARAAVWYKHQSPTASKILEVHIAAKFGAVRLAEFPFVYGIEERDGLLRMLRLIFTNQSLGEDHLSLSKFLIRRPALRIHLPVPPYSSDLPKGLWKGSLKESEHSSGVDLILTVQKVDTTAKFLE